VHFQHRGFEIECHVSNAGSRFVGSAEISRSATNHLTSKAFSTGPLKAFDTETAALGYARFFAEIWCDENFI
jgi:hypothetical protein